MERNSFLKKANYYKKKKEYLEHYQLKQIDDYALNKRNSIMKRNLIIIGLIYLANYNHRMANSFSEYYPRFLFNIELAVLIMYNVWNVFLKRLFYSGKINASFKRDYQSMSSSIIYLKRLTYGARLRSMLIQLVFLSRMITIGGTFDIIVAEYSDMFRGLFFWPTIISGVLFIYLVYYRGAYVSIEEYSSRMIEYLKLGFNEQDSYNKLISRVDEELGLDSFNGILYKNKSYDPLASNSNGNDLFDWEEMLKLTEEDI